MKLGGMVACAMVALAGVGGAHAQAQCGQIAELMTRGHAAVRSLQGAVTKDGAEEAVYLTSIRMQGFEECILSSNKAVDKYNDYWEHQLACSGEQDSADAADKLIAGMWGCTQDLFVEREPYEIFVGDAYRVAGFGGSVPVDGREAGLIQFGETEHARIDVSKPFDESDEYALNIYWYFLK